MGAQTGASPKLLRRQLYLAIVVFVALRIIYTYLIPVGLGDTGHYLDQTEQILQGQWTDLDLYWFLGYFLFVVPFTWLGLSVSWAALVSSFLFASLGALATYRIGRHLAGDEIAVFALWIYAIHPIAIKAAANSTMENFYVACFLAGTWLLLEACSRRAVLVAAAGGLGFGLSVLLRNEALFLVFAMVGAFGLRAFFAEKRRLLSRAFLLRLLPLATTVLACSLVVGLWVVTAGAKVDGKVFFAKTEAASAGWPSDEEPAAYARALIDFKEGKGLTERSVVDRLAANVRIFPRVYAKSFVSPLLFLLPFIVAWLAPRVRRDELSGYYPIMATMLLGMLGYTVTLLTNRYYFLSAMLSIAPACLGYALLRRRYPAPWVRLLLFVLLPLMLVVGFGARTYRDYPACLSTAGLERIYVSELREGDLVYAPFAQVPLGVREISEDLNVQYRALPLVAREDLASLIPTDRERVFVFFDARYIQKFFKEGAYLKDITSDESSELVVTRVVRIDRSKRNRGYLLRLERPDDGRPEP